MICSSTFQVDVGGESKSNDGPRVVTNHLEIDGPIGGGDPGRTTMYGMIYSARTSGHTKNSAILDILDESMLNCLKSKEGRCIIGIFENFDGNVSKIQTSDNIEGGFQNLDKNGDKNPLNTVYRNEERHYNDEELSSHGQGLVMAARLICDCWEILTKEQKSKLLFKYYHLKHDWDKMIENDDTKPEFMLNAKEEYCQHPFKTGTTLTFTGCRKKVFDGKFQNIVDSIKNTIECAYSKLLMKARKTNIHPNFVELHVHYKNGEKKIIVIEPNLTPIDDPEHPHKKVSVTVEYYENTNDSTKIRVHKYEEKKGIQKLLTFDFKKEKFLVIPKKKRKNMMKKLRIIIN